MNAVDPTTIKPLFVIFVISYTPHTPRYYFFAILPGQCGQNKERNRGRRKEVNLQFVMMSIPSTRLHKEEGQYKEIGKWYMR